MYEWSKVNWTQRIMTAMSVIAMLVGFIAMTVMWLNAETASDSVRAEAKQLRDTLDLQVQGTSACDARLASACDGLWACDWRWKIQEKIVSDKDVDAWLRALRKQDIGLVACKKSYPKGAEYQGGSK